MAASQRRRRAMSKRLASASESRAGKMCDFPGISQVSPRVRSDIIVDLLFLTDKDVGRHGRRGGRRTSAQIATAGDLAALSHTNV
jgi:hypothetical protein